MSEIRSYKDLFIWQKGIKIVSLIYQLVKSFPKEELFALTSQTLYKEILNQIEEESKMINAFSKTLKD
ncbi:four helix bundle protein [uncultured Flavobacterium sp.]|uniref:four helix bundle protein n=1 Tax=uncultured Flavobacterium sp. TaxID=165435 RepID=UPI002930FF81|nr:four helix bundle protein [uncultured Flavobacterium sp.]